jgi:PIN domain-containing protein
MLEFNRIYLDSQPLRAGNWPLVSAKLQTVLQLAAAHGVCVCIPVPVESELEAQWFRDYEERVAQLRNRVSDFNKSVRALHPAIDLKPEISEVETRSGYHAAVANAKQQWSIQTVPMVECAVRDVFEMALKGGAPFKKNKGDSGFKDAVIFLSVMADLRRHSGSVGAFLTADRDFAAEELSSLAGVSGVCLKFFKAPEELEKLFKSELTKQYVEEWEQAKTWVAEQLEKRSSEIVQFLSANLRLTDYDFVGPFRVIRIDAIKEVSVGKIYIPHPSAWEQGKAVDVTFDASVTLSVTVERVSMRPPRTLEVGGQESGDEETQAFFDYLRPHPEMPDFGQLEQTKGFTIDAKGTLLADDGTFNFQFLSVRQNLEIFRSELRKKVFAPPLGLLKAIEQLPGAS